MKFSTVVIAKNEEKTLPRLIKSLEGVDEIIVCDTGSTDNTIKVAKSLGATVFEKKFDIIVDEALKKKIDEIVGENNIKVGDRAFNFAEARNWAITHAKNDMIFMPDCDEIVEWDLPEVERLLDEGVDRLEYHFIFCFDAEGKPLIQFSHSKLYNRKKFHWVRNIHEVLEGQGKTVYTDKILLKHYQNPETNRGQYLKGLAIDYIQNPYNDRNCHYFAREMMYAGKPKEAIKMFEQHIEKPGWNTEKGQSLIFMGNCYRTLKDEQKAMECYARGFTYDMNRREALLGMAQVKYDNAQWVEAERLYWSAVMIPKGNYYANWAPNYGHFPWGQLSVCLFNQGRKEEAKKCLMKALEYEPNNETYKGNLKFFFEEFPKPKVSIIIPTLNREEKLKKVLEEIDKNASYPDYEVIVMRDNFENRKGAPILVKEGVEKSKGELVMFLADDTIPQKDFLLLAVKKMYDTFGAEMDGLVGLNDMYWHGEFATHWLASKKLLPYLDGEFFHTGYHHNGCDNELTERCRKMGKYVWSEEAKVFHDHPIRPDFKGEDDETYKVVRKYYEEDRALLKKRSEMLGFELRENFIHPDIKLSAVVTFKNKANLTRTAIESLIENTKSLGEIIIIDDGSTEDFSQHLEYLKRHGKPIIYRTTEENNRGLIPAWNLGASLAKFSYIVVLNNDLLFSPNWDQPLINALNDDVWMVSPYHTGGKLPKDFPQGKERHNNLVGQNTGLPFLGSCFMMKKETWNRVGPIDERLRIFCGDNYLYEIIKVDFEKQTKEIPESYIHHFCKQTIKDMPSDLNKTDIEKFEKIYDERNWAGRKKYCYMPASIDLRLILPIKDLHKMKVLNIGVGDCMSGLARQLPLLNFGQLDNIDIVQSYIDEAKKLEWTCKNINFINKDLRDTDFTGYDFVMIFDVLEHLEKNEAIKVIEKLDKAFVFIPLEKQFRENTYGVESQDHKSFWTEKDFRDMEFKTIVLPGFHGSGRGDALWAIKYE